MGLYAMHCATCSKTVERRVAYARRDQERCDGCGGELTAEISMTQPGRVDGQHRMGAYMADGGFVPGHFGVQAKRYKGLN